MTQAIISLNPMARFFEEPELVESIEIGHLLVALKQLHDLADFVNRSPDSHCDAATMMAYLIGEIEKNIDLPPHFKYPQRQD